MSVASATLLFSFNIYHKNVFVVNIVVTLLPKQGGK